VSERLAIVDLGSNAARFTLARVRPGVAFQVLREERVQTRLGAGPAGTLPSAAVRQTLEAVHRFLADVRARTSPRVLAVATAAVRDAANAGRLRHALRRGEGVDLRILSGEEEARLGALAALWSLPLDRGAVVDLGGGSLQISRVRGGRVARAASVPLGAVRATLRFLAHDPPAPREIRALRRETRDRLLGLLPRAEPGDGLIGLGGTIRALGRMHLRAHDRRRTSLHRVRLGREDVTALRARLEPLDVRARRRVRGLKAERADTIVAGLVMVEELMLLGGYEALTICAHGVRHGLLIRETFPGALGP
jgi:exopolyphosphatase/guanosine-5'-triphosphate,3'-diphosphate pyrophosphatase